MIRILFCQPIFLASEKLKEKNFDSIKSLKYIIEYLPYDYEIIFKLEGWAFKDKFWSEFVELVSSFPIQIEYRRLEHNYGKAYVINKIVREHRDDFDYILTCDSDIVFLENQHYLERLVECNKTHPERELISMNLLKMDAHNWKILNKKKEYDGKFNKEIFFYNDSIAGGIAGGCFFINKKSWKIISGYRQINVFGGDDGVMMSDLYKKNIKTCVLKTLSVIHPWDVPGVKIFGGQYRLWKSKLNQDKTEKTKQELEELSKKSIEELWNHE